MNASNNRAKILVVEDEAVIAENLRNLLQCAGYEVPRIFMSGEEALEEIKKSPPQLLIMDIRLKGRLDGVETVILAEEIVGKIFSVIFLTAHSQAQFPHMTDVKSRFAFINKPYSPNELLQTVRQLLRAQK